MSLGSGPFDVGFDSYTPGGGGGGYFGGGGGTIAAGDSRDGSSGGGGGSSFISSRVSHGGMETGTGYMPGGITVADRGGGQVGFGRSYRCILCQEYPDFMKTICNDEYSELVQAQTGTECEVNSGNPIERPDFTSGHGRVVIDLVCQVRRRPSDQNTRSRSPVYRWNPSGVVTRRVEMTSDALQISSTDEIEAGSWYGGALARPGISSTGESVFEIEVSGDGSTRKNNFMIGVCRPGIDMTDRWMQSPDAYLFHSAGPGDGPLVGGEMPVLPGRGYFFDGDRLATLDTAPFEYGMNVLVDGLTHANIRVRYNRDGGTLKFETMATSDKAAGGEPIPMARPVPTNPMPIMGLQGDLAFCVSMAAPHITMRIVAP